jgi:hypothetical protein
MPLSIMRADEEIYRQAEYNVNQLCDVWGKRYKDKSSKEILAMVAFQFAKLYFASKASVEETESMLNKMEAELDRLLIATGDGQ